MPSLERSCGILLHITSLPSPYGIGDFGEDAYQFINTIKDRGFKWWQVLPLNMVNQIGSPYSALSAFAGNTQLISPVELKKAGLLTIKDFSSLEVLKLQNKIAPTRVDFELVQQLKNIFLEMAYKNYCKSPEMEISHDFYHFKKEEKKWLKPWAHYCVRNELFSNNLNEWHAREHEINSSNFKIQDRLEFYQFTQYLFYKQWKSLKSHANTAGIKIMGDLPIYLALNSCDVWSQPHLFQLDQHKNPSYVAGVPPDCFSKQGQLWGNPLYNWDDMKNDHFRWWIKRLEMITRHFDFTRIDHFRGYQAYWRIPYGETTGKNGEWITAPGFELFEEVKKQLPNVSFFAEDLGIITPEVEDLRTHFNFPGMKVLQFGFGSGDINEHLPHNIPDDTIYYSGTHDNSPLVSWKKNASQYEIDYAQKYMKCSFDNIEWNIVKTILTSRAIVAMIPLQDILNLDEEARMNTPGIQQQTKNWSWRFSWSDLESIEWDTWSKAIKESGR